MVPSTQPLPALANPPEGVTIRIMTPADFEEADALRFLAGWNQTMADWHRFVTCAPEGCFVAHRHGALAGTATTITYGQELGWIGMLLVHPDHRRCGIGRALLQRSIEHLKGQRVRSIKLDATPLGKPLYEQEGFQSELSLTRWQAAAIAFAAPEPLPSSRGFSEADLDDMTALDGMAFGVSRRSLLLELCHQEGHTLLHCSPGGALEAFGMIRVGARAQYLGPVIATSAALGEQLVLELLAREPGTMVYWDVLDSNVPAAALAQSLGFTPQRNLLRMFLGQKFAKADPRLQWAIVDPAVG